MSGADTFAALRDAAAAARARLCGADAPAPPLPRLDALAAAFRLSGFEREALLVAAGVEVDEGLAPALGEIDPEGRGALCFAPLLARIPGAHWSALAPDGPLRRWELLRIADTRPLARAGLGVDERILHHLAGLDPLDPRLAPYLEAVAPPRSLPEALARPLAEARAACARARPPLIEIEADDPRDVRAVAAALAEGAGAGLWAARGPDLPTAAAERRGLTTLWRREVLLAGRALLVGRDAPDAALAELAEGPGLLFAHGSAAGAGAARGRLRVRLEPMEAEAQAQAWRAALGTRAARLNGALDRVTRHFSLGFSDIAEAADALPPSIAGDAGPALWEAARAVSRPRLRGLAVEVAARAGWRDIVLPARETAALRAIAAQVRHRRTVYAEWGFAPVAGGLGVAALFCGPSGAGKTMAAEVLARELELDLFRIDLSRVVSKYIGETEKNLASVFDAAEDGGAILLFDEADALFGKRSEVRDSHDRYANMEVSYLLQRMEAHRGLAILTTNFRAALDRAFARRLRYVVEFPFPGYAERVEIWRRAFPPRARTEGVDPLRLARLGVAGGAIRNIALNAAFLAAEEGAPIRMSHLGQAAEAECAKLEKAVTRAEIGDWT